ncbi:MAG TPA: serine/threonine-protein kinase [Candidatus Limnocylindrales bacterium]|nr:serine/threonine-protein kinase [Candidatus Limnocylindrales bacterium]
MDNSPEINQDGVGTRKGDYEILELLGTGGMGQVFKVRNVYSDRIEAMKILLPNLADQKNLADRFMREIKVLAGLHHPNIAELRTALTINNQLVMIMEYVEGTTLAARVQQGAIPYGQALGYIAQVLSALSYAHSQHVIHRDIKPSNMMLTPAGVVKLMDFGIAQQGEQGDLTRTNTTVGSFAYMSPEQIKGEAVDARSDLYSVGVSLYEMVTGQRPFPADTAFSAMQAHLQTPPRPPIELRPDLPSALSDLIVMAVAKDPAARFQSADAFAAALQSVAPKVAGTLADIPLPVVPMAPVAAVGQTATPSRTGASASASAPAAKIPSAPVVPVPAAQTLPMPPAATQKTHRGLYITLGALIVFAVVAAAAVVPWHAKAHKGTSSATSTDASATPTPAPGPTPAPAPDSSGSAATPSPAPSTPNPDATPAPAPAPSSAGAEPVAPTPAPAPAPSPVASVPAPTPAPTPSPARHHRPPQMPAPDQTPGPAPSGQSSAAPSDQASGADPAEELKAVDLENDQLSSRASAVNASLDTLQKQQAAAGYGLRGDIVSSQQRMQNYLAKAQAALDRQDAKGAKKYLDLAAVEVEKIERFLGR